MLEIVMADLEVLETEAQKAAGEAALGKYFSALDQLPLGLANVVAGSRLADDDASNNYMPISGQAEHLLGSARDHLNTMKTFIEATHSVPTFALYTLIRSAIEASAVAIWLPSVGTKDKRILRSLQMTTHDRADVDQVSTMLGVNNDAGAARMKKQLDEIKAARTGLNQHDIAKFPTKTRIIEDADQVVPAENFTGLMVWKSCSGLAHANQQTALMLLSRTGSAQNTGQAPVQQYSTSIALLSMMFKVALNFYTQARALYDAADTSIKK